jgi:regulator of replication initiation timing
MSRAELIERKEAVRAEIARIRQQLARARQTRQIEALEARLAALMAEEHSLRLRIDRTE